MTNDLIMKIFVIKCLSIKITLSIILNYKCYFFIKNELLSK